MNLLLPGTGWGQNKTSYVLPVCNRGANKNISTMVVN